MSQEKATIHPLFAVPKKAEQSPVEEDFQRFSETDEESEVCRLCFGSGMEVVPGKGARVCQCRKQNSHTKLLKTTRIPKRYENCHFHSYRALNPSQERAFRFASRLAMEYPAIERGLLLMGTVGVGKTHLAVSILKGLTERGFSCLFYEFGGLLKEIQNSYNYVSQTSELGVLSPVFEAEILVLDEIGASKPTEWVRDTMSHIINTRYNDKKLTIFTTNYLDNVSNEREETLEDRVGIRMRSRLFEMSKTVIINGEDFRQTFDQVTQMKKRP
ncbi:MAG: ATP-binding protein [Acidobacteriota bacterium]|jgi:DNA replication protein DnaC|nr:ATP-binding protein [Acidobacteriota bacterium]